MLTEMILNSQIGKGLDHIRDYAKERKIAPFGKSGISVLLERLLQYASPGLDEGRILRSFVENGSDLILGLC